MIIVTGGAGFIGSNIVHKLNRSGRNDILIVDELGTDEKWKNLVGLRYADFINKIDFINMVMEGYDFSAEGIIHMGANSATTEKDADHLMENNFKYTCELAQYASVNELRFVYASSAATYGDGELGFDDDETKLEDLRPLNMYGYSKALFDIYAKTNGLLKSIAGVKYFNVYGPNEYHKGDMRSVVHKAFEQINETGKVKLFKSNHPDYKDGEQMRDFIYVDDAVDMTLFLYNNKNVNGVFNVGAGEARTWKDLVTAIFNALDKPVNIDFVDLPAHLADKYQYFTQANMDKIKKAGYSQKINSLEFGVTDYVKNYLLKKRHPGY